MGDDVTGELLVSVIVLAAKTPVHINVSNSRNSFIGGPALLNRWQGVINLQVKCQHTEVSAESLFQRFIHLRLISGISSEVFSFTFSTLSFAN